MLEGQVAEEVELLFDYFFFKEACLVHNSTNPTILVDLICGQCFNWTSQCSNLIQMWCTCQLWTCMLNGSCSVEAASHKYKIADHLVMVGDHKTYSRLWFGHELASAL